MTQDTIEAAPTTVPPPTTKAHSYDWIQGMNGTFTAPGMAYQWTIQKGAEKPPCGCKGCKGTKAQPTIISHCLTFPVAGCTDFQIEACLRTKGILNKALFLQVRTVVRAAAALYGIKIKNRTTPNSLTYTGGAA